MTGLAQQDNDTRLIIAEGPPQPFSEDEIQRPFLFSHRLASHPLFEMPQILALARRLEGAKTTYGFDRLHLNVGQVETGHKPTQIGNQTGIGLEDAILGMSQSDSWLVLKQLEHDPDYGPLLLPYATALRELLPASLRPHLSDPVIHIMVSSPRRVTPYHNDHEVAVLMQVRGRKHISIFDQTDRSVLSEQEIERLYIGDIDAARYRDGIQEKAAVFELVPGVGVNIPSLAPHWVQNGDEVSISVNINFRVADYIRADLYRANYHLRRIGLNPRPPGRSKLRDAMKKTLYRTYKRIARSRA